MWWGHLRKEFKPAAGEMCLQDTHNRIAECIYSAQRLPLTGPVNLAGIITPAEFCSMLDKGKDLRANRTV